MGLVRRVSSIALTLGLGTAGLVGATASATAATPTTQEFTFAGTGVAQTYVVPNGVTVVQLQLFGAQGGKGGSCGQFWHCGPGGSGGLGAEVLTSLNVVPGEALTIVVGGAGTVGYVNGRWSGGGGGGGGLTSVYVAGTPVAIAGGGGGGGGSTNEGAGGRGGSSGGNGYTSSSTCAGHGGISPVIGGAPGSQGGWYTRWYCAGGQAGGNGSFMVGGNGGFGTYGQQGWISGADGGAGGAGVFGGGGGGGGGLGGDSDIGSEEAGVGGGGAGGTSSHYGNPGLVLEGLHFGNGEVIVTPLPGGAPGSKPPKPCHRAHDFSRGICKPRHA